jgi:two-component system chemotaxis sensor kinase CheA
MPPDVTPESVIALFLQEAEEGLTAMEQALIELDERPGSAAPLNEVFRIAHTIKSSAAMVDYAAVAELSHSFEDALTVMRDGIVPVTPERVTVMLQVVDILRGMINAQSHGQTVRLRSADAQLVARLVPADLQAKGAEGDTAEHEASQGDEKSSLASAKGRSLRVEKTKLDAMLTLSGEIAVAKGRLNQVLTAANVGEAGLAAAEQLNRLLATLHEYVTEMRLVPIGPLFRQHLRTIRDIGANESKLLKLVLEGEDVEVDATIVEQLRDPLTHLVRNAIDHGIEFPAARHAAGKDPCGTVTLHARHERGTVIVEIRDDGKGMSKERLLAKGLERGLISEDDELTDAQIFALSMAPGLSTAERITELSGRGVGMDVVRRNVEAMRGSIEIISTEGAGTTMRLRLPLTVAIIDGFVVGVADERYVVPVSSVSECLTASETMPGAATGVISVRGTSIPYVRLRHLLAVRDNGPVARESVVIVSAAGQQAGLVVDDLLGETQAVVKPLAGLVNAVPGVSGTTIMSDGRVSLILDVGPLLDLAHRSTAHPSHRRSATTPMLS